LDINEIVLGDIISVNGVATPHPCNVGFRKPIRRKSFFSHLREEGVSLNKCLQWGPKFEGMPLVSVVKMCYIGVTVTVL